MENHLNEISFSYELDHISSILDKFLTALDDDELIEAINHLKMVISSRSPFKSNPIDRVQWLKYDQLIPNDYNPNSMAPPEKKLLELSIQENGFTQPIIVKNTDAGWMIIDGYHRHSIIKNNKMIREKNKGCVPVVVLEQTERPLLIAATVRHNRARGSHQINLMSELVKELSQLGLTDFDIGKKLGMDDDEVLRLKQITGLRELFSSVEFSNAWTVK